MLDKPSLFTHFHLWLLLTKAVPLGKRHKWYLIKMIHFLSQINWNMWKTLAVLIKHIFTLHCLYAEQAYKIWMKAELSFTTFSLQVAFALNMIYTWNIYRPSIMKYARCHFLRWPKNNSRTISFMIKVTVVKFHQIL